MTINAREVKCTNIYTNTISIAILSKPVECKDDADWVKQFMTTETNETRQRQRVWKIWWNVCEDTKSLQMTLALAINEEWKWPLKWCMCACVLLGKPGPWTFLLHYLCCHLVSESTVLWRHAVCVSAERRRYCAPRSASSYLCCRWESEGIVTLSVTLLQCVSVWWLH